MAFKVGDKVKFLGGDGPPKGTLGTVVKEKDCSQRPLVKFDGWSSGHDGTGGTGSSKSCWWVQPHEMQLIDAETSKFKEGQKVKIIGDSCCHRFKIGTIIELSNRLPNCWKVKDSGMAVKDIDIEAVAEETPKFKEGQTVKIIGKISGHGFSLGTIIRLDKRRTAESWLVVGSSYFVMDSEIKDADVEEPDGQEPKKLYVRTGNHEEWDAVLAKCYKEGKKWSSKDAPEWELRRWAILPNGEGTPGDSLRYTTADPATFTGHSTYRVISAAEYLGTKTMVTLNFGKIPESERKILDALKVIEGINSTAKLIPQFGDTPTVLDYPPEPKKIPEVLDRFHCSICRCDRRCENHATDCKNRLGQNFAELKDTPEVVKILSDKPSNKQFTRFFEDFSKKLMN